MGPPIGSKELPRFGPPHRNAAIDHRDKVSLGDDLQDVARGRPIHATEQHVAVERSFVSARFLEVSRDSVRTEYFRHSMPVKSYQTRIMGASAVLRILSRRRKSLETT